MLKFSTALATLCLGITMVTPASAHFSQVFSPFKAQMVASSVVAEIKTTCAGTYVSAINLGWIEAD
jgi:hypothetical protein